MDGSRYSILNFTANGRNVQYRRAFTVSGTGNAEILMVGGGGGGGDGNAAGGGGGAGAVLLGNLTLVPGDYNIIVGPGGRPAGEPGNNGENKPGYCGQHTRLQFPSGQTVTAYGGAGANGYMGPFRIDGATRASCESWNFGGGGAGPDNNHNSHTALTGSRPRYSSDQLSNVNVTEYKNFGHNYPDAQGRQVGGGGGGAGGNGEHPQTHPTSPPRTPATRATNSCTTPARPKLHVVASFHIFPQGMCRLMSISCAGRGTYAQATPIGGPADSG